MIGTSDIGAVLVEVIVPIPGYMGLIYLDGINNIKIFECIKHIRSIVYVGIYTGSDSLPEYSFRPFSLVILSTISFLTSSVNH